MRTRSLVTTIALLAFLLMGCFTGPELRVTAGQSTFEAGKPGSFTAEYTSGSYLSFDITWRDVTGEAQWAAQNAEGMTVGMDFSRPGEYLVIANYQGQTASTRVTVTGTESTQAAGGEGDVAMSLDVAEQADPATLEEIVSIGNLGGVENGGKPYTFTTDRPRRIRQLYSYHYNLGKGTSGGGELSLKAADGTVFGPYPVNRTGAAGNSGEAPNGYWWADVDFELPAGTYTFIDSDPSTWAQNAESKGIGFCAVKALK